MVTKDFRPLATNANTLVMTESHYLDDLQSYLKSIST